MTALVLTYGGPLVGALAGFSLAAWVRPGPVRPGSQDRNNI